MAMKIMLNHCKIIKEDGLLPFNAEAVARLIEHGARVCSQQDKLITKFSDLAREGNYLAEKANKRVVTDDHVNQAIARNQKKRAGLSSRNARVSRWQLLDDRWSYSWTNQWFGGHFMQGQWCMMVFLQGSPPQLTRKAGVIDIEGWKIWPTTPKDFT
jgi:hypothetical protein